MTEWLLVGLGVLLTIGTALFVAGEFSLVSVDRPAVERAVEAGDRRAEGVLRGASARLSTQLSGAQVGITLTTLVVGFLVEPSLAALLEPPLRSAGVPPDLVPPARRRSRPVPRDRLLDDHRRAAAEEPRHLGPAAPPRRSSRARCGPSPAPSAR